MKKKIFRQRLSYRHADFHQSLEIGLAGVSMPLEAGRNYNEEFGVSDDTFQLGSLFGSINSAKFYDGITADSVVPKPEDFIEVPFRLLSATVVGAGTWKATDFTNATVLKRSAPKLNNKPIYKDHETDLDNWVGLIKGTKWTAETVQNGVKVPAGIDGLMAIDAKTNPKIARGILLGSIFSNSVTVDFEWKMSHDFENEYDFYNKVGTLGADGKMIRRVVTDIHDYYESSLVWLGADPFAKAIAEDGTLKNIDESSIYSYAKLPFSKDCSNFGEENDEIKNVLEKEKKLKISFGLEKNVISLATREVPIQTDTTMNKKFLLAFLAAFGGAIGFSKEQFDTVTEDEVIEKLGGLSLMTPEDSSAVALGKAIIPIAAKFLKEGETATPEMFANLSLITAEDLTAAEDAKTKLASFETEKSNFTKEKEEFEKTKTALTANAKIGEQYLADKQAEAIRLYKLAVGEEKSNDTVIGMFKKANHEELEGLLQSYTKEATGKFSGTCKDCGSGNFTFQSTFSSETTEGVTDNTDGILTAAEIREQARRGSFVVGRKEA